MPNILPVLYRHPVVLDRQAHARLSVRAPENHAFARHAHAVPLTLDEFASVFPYYPILFVKASGCWSAVALCGLRPNENLYVTDAGEWADAYVPAYVRRYPFILGEPAGAAPAPGPAADSLPPATSDQRFVCLDRAFEGVNEIGEGHALFDEKGQPSEFTQHAIAFAGLYDREAALTRDLIGRLAQYDLLRQVDATMTLNTGAAFQLRDFHVVDRTQLNALAPRKLAELVRSRDIDAALLQCHSMRAFERLAQRKARQPVKPAPSANLERTEAE